MKINKIGGIQPSARSQTTRKSSDVNFASMLQAEMDEVTPVASNTSQQQSSPPQKQTHELIEEVTDLLDQALHQLDAGEAPGDEVLNAIVQLRSQLQQQPNSSQTLEQAQTILAVESERVRSLQG